MLKYERIAVLIKKYMLFFINRILMIIIAGTRLHHRGRHDLLDLLPRRYRLQCHREP